MTSTNDPFEFLKNLWGPMGLPLPGWAAPTLNPAELERRIAELKSVEGWLNMNLGALRVTIQALEMQKAALAAVQEAAAASQGGAAAGDPSELARMWWKMFQQAVSAGGGASSPGEQEKK